MHIFAQAFWLSKAGNSIEEYEDAFCPQQTIDEYAQTFRFAVADGATETSFSKLWAEMLVQTYCTGQPIFKSLTKLQQNWLEEVSKKPLPWFAEEKLRSGAFSSIIGLTISQTRNGTASSWKVSAIGDSCLFQVRDDALITSHPITSSKQFHNRPFLLSSNPIYNKGLQKNCDKSGSVVVGDIFYLMTDALAYWFLRATELNQKPWEILRDFSGVEQVASFTAWIEDLRKTGSIRNDDVTMLYVKVLEIN